MDKTEKAGKRIINIRPAVVAAAAASVGILFSYGRNTQGVTVLFFAIAMLTAIVLTAVFFLLSRKRAFVFTLIATLFFAAGYVAFDIQFDKYHAYTPDFTEISVKVRANGTPSVRDGYVSGYFDCLEVLSDGDYSEYIGSTLKTRFYLRDDSDLAVEGAVFVLDGTIYKVSPYNDGVDHEKISNNCVYEMKVGEAVCVGVGVPTFFGSVRRYIERTLSENMSDEGGAVAKAMILGDTNALSKVNKENYKLTGLAHLFSVSGLHIGFAASLTGILFGNLFKKRKWAGFAVNTLLIWTYVAMCNFPVSAIRAAITVTVSSAFYPYRRVEPLSGLAVAAVIIMLTDPSALFDGGCLMSFSAVAGIILIGLPLRRSFQKRFTGSFARGITSSFSVSLGASVGTFPFIAQYYGEISLLSIPVNIVVVALMTVVFVMTFVCLLPLLCKLLFIPSFVITAVNSLVGCVAELGTIEVSLPSEDAWVFVLYFAVLLIAGGRLNLSKCLKLVVAAILVTALEVAYPLIPSKSTENVFMRREDVVLFATENGEVFIYGDVKDGFDVNMIEQALNGMENNDVYYITDSFPLTATAKGVGLLLERIDVKGVISSDMREHDASLRFKAMGADVLGEYAGENVRVFVAEVNGKSFPMIDCRGKKIALVRDLKRLSYQSIADKYGDIELIYAVSVSQQNARECECILITEAAVQTNKCFSTAFIGDFTIGFNCGIIDKKEVCRQGIYSGKLKFGENYAFFGA